MGKTGTDFIFLGSKITVDGDCNHEIKRHLLLGRKAITNLDSILKSTDRTLPTKVHIVKAMVFPLVMYGYESWTIKKAEHQRIDTFKRWCWRRLFNMYTIHIYHWLDGCEFGWTPGDGDGQGGLVCCESWGQTWLSDWTELNWYIVIYVYNTYILENLLIFA